MGQSRSRNHTRFEGGDYTMMLESSSIFSIILATIASIAIGFAWYGPLFGKAWAKEQGWSDMDM